MIIFLYGQDSYRSRQKLKEIIAKYENSHKNGLSLRYIDLLEQEMSFENFRAEFISLSMFQEAKLFILQNCFSAKEFRDQFLKNAQSLQDSRDVIVIYEKDKVLETTALFKFLKKTAKCQEFKLLSPQLLKAWVKKEFSHIAKEGNINFKIGEEAIDKLIEYTGNDLWRMNNEIRKLASFKEEINPSDIDQMIEEDVQSDIFKTIDFLAQKNKKQALLEIKKHLQKGESPLYLFSMINFQFRNLLLVKSYNAGSYSVDYETSKKMSFELGIHPYVMRKCIGQAQNFSLPELKKIYYKIFKADIDIKTGRMKPEIALELFVCGV